MIVAEKPRFVFVHVYKTGGTSVKRALRRYAMKPGQEFANFFFKRLGIPQFGPVHYPDHMTAGELINQIGQDSFDDYFSFGFVRNPWDWQVSMYKYIIRNRMHPDHETVKSFRGFTDYLRWRCDGRFRWQRDFVFVEQRQVVDFVGRFENLTNDFEYVCDQLQIQRRLPTLNRTRSTDFRKFYTDPLIELVNQTYRPDIDQFGYQFESVNSPARNVA